MKSTHGEDCIELLRYALACIWTEIEYNENSEEANENAAKIADDALNLTDHLPVAEKIPSVLNGIDAWSNRNSKAI